MAAAGTVSSASPVAGQGAPTSNFVGDAGQAVDADKMNALTAIAQQGSKAANVYGTTQANLGAQKTAAIKTAIARSALAGAPAANRGANVATVSAPVTNYQGLAANQAANYAQNNANMGNAFGQYFDLTKAGLPVANAALQSTIANDQEKAAEKAMSDNLSLQTKELANQLAQQKLGVGTTPDLSTEITKLGGSQLAGQILNQGASQAAAQQNAANFGSPTGLPGGMPDLGGGGGGPIVAGPPPTTPDQAAQNYYGNADQQLGVPGSGAAQSLATNSEASSLAKQTTQQNKDITAQLNAAKLPTPPNAGQLRATTGPKGYGSAQQDLASGISSGATPAQIIQGLTAKYGAAMANTVINDYGTQQSKLSSVTP